MPNRREQFLQAAKTGICDALLFEQVGRAEFHFHRITLKLARAPGQKARRWCRHGTRHFRFPMRKTLVRD
jgi:hypothetical protein